MIGREPHIVSIQAFLANDLAVLGIPSIPLPPLTLGNSASVQVGQTVIAIGFPRISALGTETSTVTQGIISAIRPGLLQMQVPISPGNSGGPVITLGGEVIGVVAATLRGEQQGINFATPINAAKPLLGGATVAAPSPVAPSPARTAPTAPSISPPSSVAPPTPPLARGRAVIPGQSIGAFLIGQDLTLIVSVLGPIHSASEFRGGAYVGYYWPLRRIGIIVEKATGKAVALSISYDDGYQTDKGITAGSDVGAIRSAYGGEESVDSHKDDETLVYNGLGVAFVIDKKGAISGRVSVIFVFGQGHYGDIFQRP